MPTFQPLIHTRSLMSATLLLLVLIAQCVPVLAAEQGDIAAIVNGRPISRADVDRSIATKLTSLEQQAYALRKSSLDAAITRLLLEEAAAKEGISADEYKRRITEGAVEVAESEVEKEYQENITTFAQISADEARERVRADLKTRLRIRKYTETVAALRAAANVEVKLEAPAAPQARPSRGRPDAPVTIALFSDFGCSYCRSSQETLRRLRETYADEVRLVYRHFPRDPAMSFEFARASVCADEQGRFWPFHDAALAAPALTRPQLDTIVSATGLDRERFTQCFASERSSDLVLDDLQEGQRLGVTGTPTAVVNGRVVRGASDFAVLSEAVQTALKGVPALSSGARK